MGSIVGVVVVVACAACGRFGFDVSSAHDGDAAAEAHDGALPGDDAPDAPAICAFQICDGFEGASLDPRWQAVSIGLDPTMAHRGTQSLHAHIDALAPGTEGKSFLVDHSILAADTAFYVRAFIWLAVLPTSTNGLELLVAQQTGGGAFGDYLFAKRADLDVYSEFSDDAMATNGPADTGRWLCVIWHLVASSSATGGEVDLAGDYSATMTTTTTSDTDPLVDLLIGAHYSATNVDVAQQPTDVWIDDLLIGTTAPTCAD